MIGVLIEATDLSTRKNLYELKMIFRVFEMTVVIKAPHSETSFRMRNEEESVK